MFLVGLNFFFVSSLCWEGLLFVPGQSDIVNFLRCLLVNILQCVVTKPMCEGTSKYRVLDVN